MATLYQPDPATWRYGLFECCDAIGSSMLALFCPPCYAAHVSNLSGESIPFSVLQLLCFPFGLCCLRPMSRSKRSIGGNVFSDCLAVSCCTCCSLVQMKREFETK